MGAPPPPQLSPHTPKNKIFAKKSTWGSIAKENIGETKTDDLISIVSDLCVHIYQIHVARMYYLSPVNY